MQCDEHVRQLTVRAPGSDQRESSGKGPGLRARERARSYQQGRSDQAERHGRVRPIGVLDDRGTRRTTVGGRVREEPAEEARGQEGRRKHVCRAAGDRTGRTCSSGTEAGPAGHPEGSGGAPRARRRVGSCSGRRSSGDQGRVRCGGRVRAGSRVCPGEGRSGSWRQAGPASRPEAGSAPRDRSGRGRTGRVRSGGEGRDPGIPGDPVVRGSGRGGIGSGSSGTRPPSYGWRVRGSSGSASGHAGLPASGWPGRRSASGWSGFCSASGCAPSGCPASRCAPSGRPGRRSASGCSASGQQPVQLHPGHAARWRASGSGRRRFRPAGCSEPGRYGAASAAGSWR